MASFDAINYSLRPSKSIQRQIVFEGLRLLQTKLSLDRVVYVGLGSIWFTDFIMAHKLLSINDMRSIEAHEIGYRRAAFNAPYATVQVKEGRSSSVLPSLYADGDLMNRPWLIWLDYDYIFDEAVADDIRSVIENAPQESILLATFSGGEMKYGKTFERPDRLKQIFGSVVPDDLSKSACREDRLQDTLANIALDFMKAAAADISRPGGFLPAFQIIYKDGTPMITVGGVLPAANRADAVRELVNSSTWPCRPLKRIVAPHLTVREAAALQSLLPRRERLSRDNVRELGFDLEDEQIEVYETYYRQYPSFAQIVT